MKYSSYGLAMMKSSEKKFVEKMWKCEKNSSQTNHIKAENKNGLAKMNSMGRQKKI